MVMCLYRLFSSCCWSLKGCNWQRLNSQLLNSNQWHQRFTIRYLWTAMCITAFCILPSWPPFSVSVRLIENRLTEIFSVNRLTENIPITKILLMSAKTQKQNSNGHRPKTPHMKEAAFAAAWLFSRCFWKFYSYTCVVSFHCLAAAAAAAGCPDF